MIMDTIRRTCAQHALLEAGQHVVVGFSGGPDSLVLMEFLGGLREEAGLTIHAVHVNHGLRGSEADADEAFVRAYCAERGIDCTVVRVDCAQEASARGLTEEEAGRWLRYAAFEEAARQICRGGVPAGKVRIAVAHNRDDQAETVLLRLLRGTGPDGLAGMPYVRADRAGFPVVRPLLDVPAAEIRAYCQEQGLAPREDRTNAEPRYARYRVRLDLLPALEKYYPNVRAALVRLAGVCAEDRSYLQEEAKKALDAALCARSKAALAADAAALGALPRAIAKRAVLCALKELGMEEDVTAAHLDDALRLVQGEDPSAALLLPHGFRIRRVYGQVRFEAPEGAPAVGTPGDTQATGAQCADTQTPGAQAAGAQGTARLGLRVRTLSREDWDRMAERPPAGTWAAFDKDALCERYGTDAPDMIRLRTREPGDFLTVRTQGGTGRKKLQDLFVDRKVPRLERGQLLFAAAGQEVLLVPADPASGRRAAYSAAFPVTAETKQVLFVETFPSL